VAASRSKASRSSADFAWSLFLRAESVAADEDRCVFFELPEFALDLDRSRFFVRLLFATVPKLPEYQSPATDHWIQRPNYVANGI
jgi:hypothetical protein